MLRRRKPIIQQNREYTQNPYMQRQINKARQEALIDTFLTDYAEERAGSKQGEQHEILCKHIRRVVQERFPQLGEVAQQRLVCISEGQELQDLFYGLLTASDQQAARQVLEKKS